LGLQTQPDLRFKEAFPAGISIEDPYSWGRNALNACQQATSWAVAYQPQGQSAHGLGIFTAMVELRRERSLALSFLHHMAVQRNVHNPFEKSDVVGITNYIDVAFQMVADIGGGGGEGLGNATGGSSSVGRNTMRLAASWQANKNIMVKGRVGMDGVGAAAVIKSWWQPAFTLGVAVSKEYDGLPVRLGLTMAVETYNKLRYERSAHSQKMFGSRVSQRHIASEEDMAYEKGAGLLVPLQDVDDPAILGQIPAAGADYL